jgi:bidirectional [NiFe] hydrogenase diaphorase subunit
MAVITLTIDEVTVSAKEGESLLEAIRDAGIDIPTLCHLDGLSERGGCRLCLVDVAGSRRLLPACTTQVKEGMVVQTHTEKLVAYRKMMLELLFAERNHICSVCVANGHCELQSLAAHLNMSHVRYDYLNQDLSVDTSHERYGLDQNRCVLCTRCLRVCDEVEGAHVWDLAGRGKSAHVITELNQPWGLSRSCTRCGKCVEVCPTGALFTKGSTVAELEKHPHFLTYILTGRTKHEWVW